MTDVETAKKLFFEALDFFDDNDFLNAESRLRAALKFTPNSASIFTNLAVTLLRQNKFVEAREIAQKAVASVPNNIEALVVLMACFIHEKNFTEAFGVCDAVIALEPTNPELHNSRGVIFAGLRRFPEALASYERAIALNPNYAEAWTNRGNAFCKLKRYQEALAAYDRAQALKPNLSEIWLGRGEALNELDQFDPALAAFDAALKLNPDLAEAWLGRGNVFIAIGHHEDALSAYDKAVSLRPDLAEVWLGRGNGYFKFRRYEEALADLEKAITISRNLADARTARINILNLCQRYSDVVIECDKALQAIPDIDEVAGTRLHAKMQLCDWRDFESERMQVLSSIAGGPIVSPFILLPVSSSSYDLLQCARRYNAKKFPASEKPIWQGERYNHDRIRVAYLSGEFRDHPVSYLLAGVLEQHDRNRFETIAISVGPDDGGTMRPRIKASFDRFVEADGQSDIAVARMLRDLEVDIVVDLMGYTGEMRTAVLARRPAPIQACYLGYAGTLGADFVDYLIADATVIPPPRQADYAEKIVYLPNSFMPNDSKRAISNKAFDRAMFGLPPAGFVFCCFNNSYKINPETFDLWMRLLKKIDGSIVWLTESNDTASANLKKEAEARGVDPARLVFAKRMTLVSDHLARYRLADLFLDALPYNAHTTACDALWVGLPVLTQAGETFAGRVAASLLTAIGLPELITSTPQAYEDLAIELAANPDKLARMKRKLADNRLTAPLFDTQRTAKHLEAGYLAMVQRHQAGLPPDHIIVPQ
ncbi:MAG: tetratricopeptide repeat protein [Pseudolabrys sp.]